MHNRALRLCLLAVIGLSACQGTVAPSPPAGSIPASGEASAGPSTEAPSAVPRIADLFGTTYAPEAGRDGGSIVVGDWHEANQFHPYFVTADSDARVASAAWSTLVVLTADQKFEPDLAADIPTTANGGVRVPGDSGDAMTVTWQLRENLTWSDGAPLTCDDMKYAWEWVTDPANVGVNPAGFENIKAVDCPSATDMVWHFDRVYEAYLTLMTAPLPRHYLAAIPLADQTAGVGFRATEVATVPVSGPFKFESVAPGSELRMIRNPQYLGWSSGKPAHLDRLTWRWFGDTEALTAGYRNRDVDVATGLLDSDRPKVASLAQQVSAIPSLTYELLRPNWSPTSCSRGALVAGRGPGCPMSDPVLRRAVALAIDKGEIVKLLGGNVEAIDGNVSPDSWFFAGQPAQSSDPARARSILDEAGWVVGAGGIRERDGLRARIELCTTDDPTRVASIALIGSRLRDVGIEAVPHAVTADVMFSDDASATGDSACVLARGTFDLAQVESTRSLDPLGNFFRYHSSQIPPNGANDAAVSDPLIDTALRTVQTSADFGVIDDAMAEFQRVSIEKTVEVPLYSRMLVELHSPRLGNFVASPTPAGSTWNVADWFVRR